MSGFFVERPPEARRIYSDWAFGYALALTVYTIAALIPDIGERNPSPGREPETGRESGPPFGEDRWGGRPARRAGTVRSPAASSGRRAPGARG